MKKNRENPVLVFAFECEEFYQLAAYGNTETTSYTEAFNVLMQCDTKYGNMTKEYRNKLKEMNNRV